MLSHSSLAPFLTYTFTLGLFMALWLSDLEVFVDGVIKQPDELSPKSYNATCDSGVPLMFGGFWPNTSFRYVCFNVRHGFRVCRGRAGVAMLIKEGRGRKTTRF